MKKDSVPMPEKNLIELMNLTAKSVIEIANSKSVLSEPVVSEGVTVIPVSKISVGFAGGGADVSDKKKKKANTPAGAGAKVNIVPLNYIVISDGRARLISAEPPKSSSTGITDVIFDIIKSVKNKKNKNQ